MAKVTSISGGKKDVERCEYCGEPDHPQALMCPRITSITYHEDGDVTVRFTQAKAITFVKEDRDDTDR